jgi:hypothetical protein
MKVVQPTPETLFMKNRQYIRKLRMSNFDIMNQPLSHFSAATLNLQHFFQHMKSAHPFHFPERVFVKHGLKLMPSFLTEVLFTQTSPAPNFLSNSLYFSLKMQKQRVKIKFNQLHGA